MNALCEAAKRHVVVQVVLPEKNDVGILKLTGRAYYPQLIAAGVEVYEYTDRMAHEKVATIDGKWVTAGSSNLDDRSLEFNDELNYVVIDPRLAKKVDSDLFDKDIEHSQRITSAKNGPKDWLLRKLSGWL